MKQVPKDFFYDNSDKPQTSFSKQNVKAHTYQFPINESEEFYDPFSDISLFLAKKIKKQVLCTKKKNWSASIQKTLVKEILPEFIHKFPKYHLRISALQKTFDKVQYYIRTLKQKSGQISESGKINLHKIIRENLRQINTASYSQHPFNVSHSLAVRISECIATVDNTRPNIVELTKLIWSGQKNLMLKKDLSIKCPFESFDSQDKLIARLQIQTIAEHPNVGEKELRESIKRKLVYLQQIKRMRCKKTLNTLYWTILAKKTDSHLEFHQTLNIEEQSKILDLIKKICSDQNLAHKKNLAQYANRLEFLFNLCKITSLKAARIELMACVEYIQSIETKKIQLTKIPMKNDVFDFLYEEVQLHAKEVSSHTIVDSLLSHFDLIQSLCKIPESIIQEIPILFFCHVNEILNPLKNVSKAMQEVIFHEISFQKLEKNNLINQEAIDRSIEYIQNQEIQINGIVKKIYPWTLQNDMIFQYLHFDQTAPLFQVTKKHFNKSLLMTSTCLNKSIQVICNTYLTKNPSLKPLKNQLMRQILIFYKAIYYNTYEHLTPYQLFLQYQFMLSLGKNQDEFQEVQITTLFSKSESLTPLMPFSRTQIRHLIDDVKKQLKFA